MPDIAKDTPMIDVHAPDHRIGGFRDFLMHMLTITLGLLIAIGLENAVEAMHRRHLRHEAEANILAEIRENRSALNAAAPVVVDERKSLVIMLKALEGAAAGQKDSMNSAVTLEFHEQPIPDAAWLTASGTGALAYMDYAEVERFSAAYKQQAMLQAAEEKALDDYLEFNPMLGLHGKDLSPADAARVLPHVEQALAHVNGMLAIGAGTLATYDEALKQ